MGKWKRRLLLQKARRPSKASPVSAFVEAHNSPGQEDEEAQRQDVAPKSPPPARLEDVDLASWLISMRSQESPPRLPSVPRPENRENVGRPPPTNIQSMDVASWLMSKGLQGSQPSVRKHEGVGKTSDNEGLASGAPKPACPSVHGTQDSTHDGPIPLQHKPGKEETVQATEGVSPPEVSPRTVIEVVVGSSAAKFHIDKEAACETSRFFQVSNEPSLSSPSSSLGSSSACSTSLPDQDPAVFQMYVQWLAARPRPEPLKYRPGEYSQEPWFSLASNACLLAERLRCAKFERYALSQFIQNCAYMPFGPWKSLEAIPRLRRSKPLERFATYWVAWNCSFLARDGAPSQYSSLKAAILASKVSKDGTPDPRLLDLDHWYRKCGGSLVPECSHNPIARERVKMEQKAIATRIAIAEREKNRRFSSESYSYEWKKQTGDGGSSS